MTYEELTGQTREHIKQLSGPRYAIHKQMLEPYNNLLKAAKEDGFRIGIFSSFRDFSAQQRIWNMKFEGKRTLYDSQGNALNYHRLQPEELVHSILRWSALPGASRHHWGTEIDVYDLNSLPKGYEIQLLPQEYAEGGVFGAFSKWLELNIERFGFFRPYKEDLGGVSPEPWHLSYAPLSIPALQTLSLELVERVIQENKMQGKDLVLNMLPKIYNRYITRVAVPGTVAFAG